MRITEIAKTHKRFSKRRPHLVNLSDPSMNELYFVWKPEFNVQPVLGRPKYKGTLLVGPDFKRTA